MSGIPAAAPSSPAEATTGASVLRGGAWNFASRLLPQLYILIVSVAAARFLGPAGMGRQSFIAFVALSATSLFSGGLAESLMRYVGESFGRERPSEATGLILWGARLSAAGAALAGGLLAAIALAGADPQAAWIFAGAAAALAILHSIPSAALIGAQRWREASIVGLLTGTFAVPGMIAVLALGGGITGMFVVEAIVAAANLVFTTVLARRAYRRLAARPAIVPAIRHAAGRFALWSTLAVVLTLIVFRRSEFFFLDHFSSDAEIAVYSIAFASIYAIALLAEALAAALSPAFATLFGAGAADRLRSGFGRGVRLLITATIPITAAVLALGPEALVLVYGDDYSNTGAVLRWMVLAVPLLPMLNVSNALLVGMGRAKPLLVVGSIAAVLNVSLALALIPRLDAVGAGLANAGAQIVVAVGMMAYASRLVGRVPIDFRALLRTVVAAVPGGLAAWLAVSALPEIVGLVLGLIACVLVFACVARLVGILRQDDADWLRAQTRGGPLERLVDRGAGFLSRRSRPLEAG
jgi:O-antigen/teichoic acid export membrane protein